MRKRTWIAVIGGGFLLTLGVLGVVGYAWLQSDAGARTIEKQVEKAVRNSIEDGGFAIGELTVEGDRLTVEDIHLDGAETERIVQIDALAASIDKSALLRKTLDLEDVRVQGVTVDIPRRDDGSLDLPVFLSNPSSTPTETTWMPAGLNLDADDIRIEDADITLPDDDLALADVDVGLSVDAGPDHLELHDLEITADAEQPDLGSVRLDGGIRFDNADLSPSALALTLADSQIDTTLSATDLLSSEPDAAVALQLGPTADVQREPIRTLLRWSGNDAAADVLEDGPALGLRGQIGGSLDVLGLQQVELDIGPTHVLSADGTVQLATSDDDATTVTLDLASTEPGPLLAEVGAPVDARSAQVPLELVLEADGSVRLSGEYVLEGVDVNQTLTAGRLDGRLTGTVAPDVRLEVEASSPRATLDAGQPVRTAVSADLVVTDTAVAGSTVLRPETDTPTTLSSDLSFTYGPGDLRFEETLLEVDGERAVASTDPITATLRDGGLDDLNATLAIVAVEEGRVVVEMGRVSGAEQRGGVRFETVPLEPIGVLASVLGQDVPGLSGRLDGDVRLDIAPDDRTLTADLSVAALEVEETLEETSFDLTADVAHDHATLDLVAHAVREEEATQARAEDEPADDAVLADLSVDLDLPPGEWMPECTGQLDLDATIPDVLLGRWVDRIVAVEESPLSDEAATVGGQLGLVGDACDPRVTVDMWVDGVYGEEELRIDGAVRDGPKHESVVNVDLLIGDRDTVHVEGFATHPRPVDWFQAEDPIDALERWRAAVELGEVPVSLVTDQLQGRFVGGAVVVGEGLEPSRANGGIAIADARLDDQPLDRVEVTFDTVAGELQAEAVVETEPARDASGDSSDADGSNSGPESLRLDATASADLDALMNDGADASFEARVEPSRFPLALITAFVPDQFDDAEGMLAVDLSASGTLGAPELDGSLEVDDAAVVARATGVRYHAMNAEIVLDGQTAVIERMNTRTRPRYGRFSDDESGRNIRVQGDVAFGGDAPELDLAIDMKEFWVVATNMAIAQLDGELAVSGPVTGPTVTGEVTVHDSRFDLDRYLFIPPAASELHPDIVFVDDMPDRFERRGDAEPGLMDRVDVDLDVDVGRSADLEAKVPVAPDAGLVGTLGDAQIDAEVDGGVNVQQQDGETRVTGRLETTGRAKLLSARFDLEQGTLAFSGRGYTSPNLDFLLRRDSGQYGAVTARVRGTPSDLEIDQLTSDSGLSRADIMAQLVFGRPLSDLGGGEGVTGAAIVERALVSVAGGELEDALGVELVDTVDFSSSEGLSVGWSLGSSAFLTVQLDPTAEERENTTAVKLNWYLSQLAEAEVRTGDRANSSAWMLLEETF